MKSNIKNLAFFRDLIEFEKHSHSFLGLYTPPSLPVCCISDNVSPLQCLPEESIGSCPPPSCLPGHVVQMVVAKTSTKSLKSGKLMAPDADVDDCPKYHCIPPGLVTPEQEQEVGVVVESRCRLQGGSISFFRFLFLLFYPRSVPLHLRRTPTQSGPLPPHTSSVHHWSMERPM